MSLQRVHQLILKGAGFKNISLKPINVEIEKMWSIYSMNYLFIKQIFMAQSVMKLLKVTVNRVDTLLNLALISNYLQIIKKIGIQKRFSASALWYRPWQIF